MMASAANDALEPDYIDDATAELQKNAFGKETKKRHKQTAKKFRSFLISRGNESADAWNVNASFVLPKEFAKENVMANFVTHQFLYAKERNFRLQPYMRMIFHYISFTLSTHGIATDLKTCASWSKLRETVRGVRNSIAYKNYVPRQATAVEAEEERSFAFVVNKKNK